MRGAARPGKWMGAALVLLLLAGLTPKLSHGGPPIAGDAFPALKLKTPEDSSHLAYLGLKSVGDEFDLSQIDARALIIEIFSMYCPHCQREAPTLNTLYQTIEASDTLRGKLKIIGIGAGNSTFEVNFFREKYNVLFPLFADADFAFHKLLGEVRTPYFFGIRIQPQDPPTVFFSKLGGARDAGALLTELVQAASLE